MNDAQRRAIARLTNTISNRCRYATRDAWINGPVVFKIEPTAHGEPILVATNNTAERRWFESDVFFMASIGPRGGVRVHAKDGVWGF